MSYRLPLLFFFLTWLLLPAVPDAQAQELPLAIDFPLEGVDAYDEAIATPDEVIGHVVGTRHTESLQVLNYFEHVAAQSDRVMLTEYARSYQNRALVYATVTSEANHARLDEIHAANERLTTDPGSVSDDELEDMPAVVYMGYSVHGDEASGTEAALLLLYHLAAGTGPAVDAALDDLVILIDPNMNPDGRDRFAYWVNQNRGGVHTTDVQDREHSQPWPRGRTNHYWFDLNRDYMPLAHPESQGKIGVYQYWRPQVLTDFHEMGRNSTYFFQPGVPERTNPRTPDLNQELTMEMARFHARQLDSLGELYWTREGFDDYYYGKGSTYPDVQGTIGILFEESSSRSLETESNFGDKHYSETVRNQFATTLSTLEGAVELRARLLRYQRDFFAEVPDRYSAFDTKAYVVGHGNDPQRAQGLAQVLKQHRVQVHALAETIEQDGQRFVPGEAFIIPMNQTQHQFIRGVMERATTFGDSLFYDVSSWTLPLAYGVPHAEVQRTPDRFVGEELTDVSFSGGAFIGGRSNVGYIMEWGRYFAPRALYRLQDAGLLTMVMTEEMTVPISGTTYEIDRGAILIPANQPEVEAAEVYRLLQQAVADDHVRVLGVESGLMPEQPDFGSSNSTMLEKPDVALVTGAGTSQYNIGEAWHLMNERYAMPASLIDADRLQSADLSRYNTIVMAGGSYGRVSSDAVESWVRSGGTLIALHTAAEWAVRNGMAELERKSLDTDSLLQGQTYADLSAARGAQNIGGSIFEAAIDNTHPLAFGYGQTAPFFRNLNRFYEPSERPGAAVATYTDDPLMSGYLSDPQRALAPGSASVEGHRVGRGRVVLMFDNPNFRAFWWGTNGFFANALFFGRSF